jgi:hypothetical protein
MTGFVSVTVGISVGIYSLFLLSVSGQAQSTPALEKGPHQTATVHRQEQRVLLESTKRAVITESV